LEEKFMRQYPGAIFLASLAMVLVGGLAALSALDHQRVERHIQATNKLVLRVEALELEVDMLQARVEDLTELLPAKKKP
jgi:hypothetical protein